MILLQLRYLQTLNSISAENNSTIIFPVPIDIINSFMGLGGQASGPLIPLPFPPPTTMHQQQQQMFLGDDDSTMTRQTLWSKTEKNIIASPVRQQFVPIEKLPPPPSIHSVFTKKVENIRSSKQLVI